MKKIIFWNIIICMFGLMVQCGNKHSAKVVSEDSQKTFDPTQSDANAIKLAEEVIDACGGLTAWEETRFIAWTFFGRRRLLWDKHQHVARIKYLDGSFDGIINLTNQTGMVNADGKELSGEELSEALKKAYRIWINDSYWLVLPFKLMDPGVKLSYLREDISMNDIPSEVIELTYQEVGVTPENKYEVYIGKQSKLIVQWNYFKNWTDTIPAIRNIWDDYMQYGEIFLSGNRGERGGLEDIRVYDQLSDNPLENLNNTHF